MMSRNEKRKTRRNKLKRARKRVLRSISAPPLFEAMEPRVLFSATPTGEISRDYWTGISGNYVSTLTNDAAYPDSPTGSDTLSTFESVDWNNPASNADFGNNYGQRIHGYLVPPTTGDYTFWISGDNESQLWLSSDQGPANRVLIASTPIYTGQYEWDKAPSQQSTVIALVAGQKYFIEVLHAEGGSNDHLAVGWLKPGEVGTAPSEIIPGSALSVWNAPPVAGDDSFETTINAVLTGTVANNDSDAENNPLTYSLTTPATHGTVNLNPDGSFTYAPNFNAPLGNIGGGIAANDAATGTGYLLYSSESIHTRFAASSPYQYNADHLIAVAESGGQWFFQNNDTGFVAFTPQVGDVLLAEVDFTNDTVTDLIGQTGSIHGIEQGYASGDITFIANQWNGSPNLGEFDVTGTFFVRNPAGLDSFAYSVDDGQGNTHTATVSVEVLSDTVYEDAQAGNADQWVVYDNNPAGATATNVFDTELNSQVIELAGDGANNGYILRHADTSNWNNTSQFVVEWKMKTPEDYNLYVSVDTSVGHRYLQYTSSNSDALGSGEYVMHGLGSDSISGNWQIFERDLQADLHEAQPGVTILDVNFIQIRGDARFDDIKLKDALTGVNQFPVVTTHKLLDTTTFSGASEVSNTAKVQVFGDTFIPIDDYDATYTLVGEARSGDGAGGQYDPANKQYFALASYDVDQYFIDTRYVYRWDSAVDTTLAQALNPGDTQIHLTDGTGWYNENNGVYRNFAWYGYADSTGHTYPDYTYTRNVKLAAWDEAGIAGNTITLNTPWTGPALAAGDAVRNSRASGSYNYIANANSPVPDAWTPYQGSISGETQNGISSPTRFRPGTAYVKVVMLMNWQGATGNLVTYRNVKVFQEDQITVDEGGSTTLIATATDPDGDALTYTWTQTAGPTATISDIHAVSPTITAPMVPSDQLLTFQVAVSDGANTSYSTVDLTVKNVPGPNTDPLATDDAATTDEETPVALDVMANDADPNGDLIDIGSFTQPAHGSVVRIGDNLVYTPSLNHFGSDSFTYTLTDGFGGSDTATINLAIANTQDVPVATTDAATTDEETPVAIDVMANDSDPDNDTLDIASFTQPAHGTVTRVGDNLVYTPTLNYFGGDSFTYVINDGHGGSDTATVNLAVTNTQDVPVATADAATTDEETPVTLDVMANDSDPDNDTLDIASFTQPAHGDVTRVGDNLVYTPSLNYFGGDSFTYTLTDGQGGSDTATVNLTIANIQDAPVAQGDAFTFFEDQVLHDTVAGNDVDADADVLTYSVLGLPQHGTVTMNGQGGFAYAPNINYAGPDSFTYTVADGHGGSDTAAVTLVGTDTPDPTDSDNEPNALGAASDGFLENTESVNTLVFELTDASKKARNAVKTSLVQPFAGAPGVRDVNRDRFIPSQAGRWNVVRSLQRVAQAEGVPQRLETDRAVPSGDSELANEAVQGDHASHQAQATADHLGSDAQDNKGVHDPSNEVLQEALQEREEDTLNLLETPVPKEDAVADVDPDRSALGGGLLGSVFLGLVAWRGRRESRRRAG